VSTGRTPNVLLPSPEGAEVLYFDWGRYIQDPGVAAYGNQRRIEGPRAPFSLTPVAHTNLAPSPIDVIAVTKPNEERYLAESSPPEPEASKRQRIVGCLALLEETEYAARPGAANAHLHEVWQGLGAQVEEAVVEELLARHGGVISTIFNVGQVMLLFLNGAVALRYGDQEALLLGVTEIAEATTLEVTRRKSLQKSEERIWRPAARGYAGIVSSNIHNSYCSDSHQ